MSNPKSRAENGIREMYVRADILTNGRLAAAQMDAWQLQALGPE